MDRTHLKIGHIPAILWGERRDKIIISVHGSQSSKTDVPIELLAQAAVPKGYQILSFDLPEHGDRQGEAARCKIQTCVAELGAVMEFAKAGWAHICLFGNSIGAYFGLTAYADEALEKAWFLSPVVDMLRLIQNMMGWFHVSEDRLRSEGEIPTPIGQTLYWDYYCFVREHPVTAWAVPTHILYAGRDDLCERDTIDAFTHAFSCDLTVLPGAGHYFHTPEELEAFRAWLDKTL